VGFGDVATAAPAAYSSTQLILLSDVAARARRIFEISAIIDAIFEGLAAVAHQVLSRGDSREHVYDGFHEGWREIHPLLTICKIDTFKLEYGKRG
jgi:hypothetical protein